MEEIQRGIFNPVYNVDAYFDQVIDLMELRKQLSLQVIQFFSEIALIPYKFHLLMNEAVRDWKNEEVFVKEVKESTAAAKSILIEPSRQEVHLSVVEANEEIIEPKREQAEDLDEQVNAAFNEIVQNGTINNKDIRSESQKQKVYSLLDGDFTEYGKVTFTDSKLFFFDVVEVIIQSSPEKLKDITNVKLQGSFKPLQYDKELYKGDRRDELHEFSNGLLCPSNYQTVSYERMLNRLLKHTELSLISEAADGNRM